ncbi:retrotransposon gag domain-containing protein [Tanacetum coccineum]
MAEENPFTVSVETLEEGPSEPDLKETLTGTDTFHATTKNHTLDHIPKNTSENAFGDPVMQFVVQKFEQINAMYSAFSSKRKEIHHTSVPNNEDHPIIEPWKSDLQGLTEGAAQKMSKDTMLPDKPTKKDDHLTIFIGTMDMNKLLEPAWCRFFHITLSGAARLRYDNLTPGCINSFHELRDKFRANFLQQRRFQKTQEEILGIRQRSDESIRDYLQRFRKETLHMTNRSDGIMIGAFISGLRPWRFFKDLIARPPASMEDLFTQAHNFIRANEANTKNRMRDSRWATNGGKSGQSYKDASRINKDKYVPRPNTRPNEHHKVHKPYFIPLIKSPTKIYATSEGKANLRPLVRMFTPAHRKDRTRYLEFHNDHGHDTNDCVDL